jgi:anaerobic selenocysteine-containing dehydrogenase
MRYSVENLREAAQMIASKKRMIICWGMGITQQHNGVEMIYNIVNLLLMKGSIGIRVEEPVLFAVIAMYRETGRY